MFGDSPRLLNLHEVDNETAYFNFLCITGFI